MFPKDLCVLRKGFPLQSSYSGDGILTISPTLGLNIYFSEPICKRKIQRSLY